jgi:hypothetical protein
MTSSLSVDRENPLTRVLSGLAMDKHHLFVAEVAKNDKCTNPGKNRDALEEAAELAAVLSREHWGEVKPEGFVFSSIPPGKIAEEST